MRPTLDPAVATDVLVAAVSDMSETVALFAEPSSAMFHLTRALGDHGDAPYARIAPHHGSMGQSLGGAVGFCAATGMRAVVLTGDGSLDLLSPIRTAVKHELRLTLAVLNDSRLSLPFIGTGHAGLTHAQATTRQPQWQYWLQGSPQVGGRRVTDLGELRSALAEALAWDGPYVIDMLIDPDVVPPLSARIESIAVMSGDAIPSFDLAA